MGSNEWLLTVVIAGPWLLLVGLAVALLRVQQEVARLGGIIEGRSSHGPPVGSAIPQLHNRLRSSGANQTEVQGGQPLPLPDPESPSVEMFWFMAANCGPCQAVKPVLRDIAGEFKDQVKMQVNCVGPEGLCREFLGDLPAEVGISYDEDRQNAASWEVFISPFVVIAVGGLVSRKIAHISLQEIQLALDGALSGTAPATSGDEEG